MSNGHDTETLNKVYNLNRYSNSYDGIDENNNNVQLKRKHRESENTHQSSVKNDRNIRKKSSKHKRKDDRSNRCDRSKSRETSKKKRKVSDSSHSRNIERSKSKELTRKKMKSKDKEISNRSRSVLNRSKSKETIRRKYSEYVDSYYLSGRFRESLAYTNRNIEQEKYDENSFKNPINTIPRYARYPFKYHQNFRPSYRYYQQSYQYNTIDYDPEYFINNTTVENEIMTDEEDLEDAVPNGESEFFTLFTNKNSSNKSKISSKIIDMLDIDWSILSTKYFDSSLASTVSSYFDSFKPSFILSTTGVMKECLDDKTFEKVKECIEKENSSGASLETLKKQVDNKIINNFAFKNSGICMRNDIERRKAMYFYQLNKHIEGLNGNTISPNSVNEDINYDLNNFHFYNLANELLKENEN